MSPHKTRKMHVQTVTMAVELAAEVGWRLRRRATADDSSPGLQKPIEPVFDAVAAAPFCGPISARPSDYSGFRIKTVHAPSLCVDRSCASKFLRVISIADTPRHFPNQK